MERYTQLRKAALAALEKAPTAVQVLVTGTRTGGISAFENDLSAEREELFLSAQMEPLAELLCLWASGQPDVPSIRVRKGLMEKDPRNGGAVLYLQGEMGIVRKRLYQCF